MRLRPKALAVAALAILMALSVSALEIQNLQYDRAISPNGDGVQDSTIISFLVDGDSVAVDSVHVGIYSTETLPPDPLDLIVALLDESPTDTIFTVDEIVWFGTEGNVPQGIALEDGFYYLQIYAAAGEDTLWRAPATQLEINIAGPTFHSVFVEPSPYFTPLAPGPDTLVYFFFNSTDFDTLTDFASAGIHREDPATGAYTEVAQAYRDADYYQLVEGIPRYRVVWDGTDSEGLIKDGRYQAELLLEDYAGNPDVSASLYVNLDALAPEINVQYFGTGGEYQLSFHFQPDSLPDSLLIQTVDRNGTAACVADWGFASPLDSVPGILIPDSAPDTSLYYFPVPVDSIVTDGSYRVTLDALDVAGNWARDLSGASTITIYLDGQAPPAPVWTTAVTEYIQKMAYLSGACSESGVDVHLYEDGEEAITVSVDEEGFFSAYVQLSEGTHDWTARSEDEAGNLSEPSSTLTLSYSPGPMIVMPGRFRGGDQESILVNASGDAMGVTMRVYTLDGEMLRVLEADGGPREFVINWDLKDDDQRDLLDGLYIVNIACILSSGERSYERKVVAIVRD